jgi:hypothetical protein
MLSVSHVGLGHTTGDETTERRLPATGELVRVSSPVLLGEVCAEVLETLFPKTFPSCARNGAFSDVSCRNES